MVLLYRGGIIVKEIYFFIGTEAELMKMFRVIQEAKQRGYDCKIVSNGQNDITNSHFLEITGGKIDIDLTRYASKEKNSVGYLKWFIKTEKLGVKVMSEIMKMNPDNPKLLVVHGDTLSTLMGARIAAKSKMPYVHVESGLRSYSMLSPFPEEIDRYFSSKKSLINFCPKEEYAKYAKKAFKGKSVNTHYNTGIETLLYALENNKNSSLKRPIEEPYFLLAIHRQENLMNNKFLKNTFKAVLELSKKMKCLFIYHEQTKNALVRCGIWEDFEKAENVVIVPRQNYFSFINCVTESEFVIADGCGNQQEFYYLGKPYLIMRTKVEENSEGLGRNAKVFGGDFENVVKFYEEYQKYKYDMIIPNAMPSNVIMDSVDEYFSSVGDK